MDLKPFTGDFLGLCVKVTGMSFIIRGVACRLMTVNADISHQHAWH